MMGQKDLRTMKKGVNKIENQGEKLVQNALKWSNKDFGETIGQL